MTEIYSKVIPQGYVDQIEEDLLRVQFPWHYIEDVTNYNYGNNSGFVHMAYDFGTEPSDWLPFIKPIIYSIEEVTGQKIEQLLRIRVGLLTKTAEPNYDTNTPHVDFLYPHKTACYYVTDSDGDTVVYNQRVSDMGANELNEHVLKEYVAKTEFTEEARCSPKKGTLCVFDGLQFHSSTKPKQHDRRIVITVNYVPSR
jgi:hypothetical protein